MKIWKRRIKINEKILVVEDEYYARKSIVKILQESDLDIQVCGEAVNGMKAIELLEEYKDIALVITDIQMKKMGGLELASYLHKHRPEIDILILTAFVNFDYAREALRYNVKDYIVKPIYKENLLPPVKKVLEKQEEKSRNQEKLRIIINGRQPKIISCEDNRGSRRIV